MGHMCSQVAWEPLRQLKYLWKWTRSKKEYLGAPGKRKNRKTKERSYSPGALGVRSAVPSTFFIPYGAELVAWGSPDQSWSPFPAWGGQEQALSLATNSPLRRVVEQGWTDTLQDITLICNHQGRTFAIRSEGSPKDIQLMTDKSNDNF